MAVSVVAGIIVSAAVHVGAVPFTEVARVLAARTLARGGGGGGAVGGSGLVGLLVGLALGGSVLLLVAALLGWRPRPTPDRSARRTRVLADPAARRRVATAVGAGLVVAVLTRWPVAVGATIVVIYLWPRMFGGARVAGEQVVRLEGLATWTESLRDSVAGSIGLEEAIRHSVTAAPPVLQPGLRRLVGQLRVQMPLPQALAGYAEEFDDSSADLVIAALILNSRLRGPGLVATLSALATSAREELDMRRRVEENRKSLRRTAMIILGVTGAFAGGLAVFSRDYVAPYGTVAGQLVLAVVLGVFAIGLMWIRSAAMVEPPPRFLGGVDQINAAMRVAEVAKVRR